MIPKSSFFRGEGKLLAIVLWTTTALFLAIMVATWVLSEKARPVMLDLETGKPVAKKPIL